MITMLINQRSHNWGGTRGPIFDTQPGWKHETSWDLHDSESCTIRMGDPKSMEQTLVELLTFGMRKIGLRHIYSQHFSTKCNNENRLYWEKPAFFWNKKNGFHFSTPQKSSLKTPTRYHISICGFNNRPRNSDPDVSELGGKAFKVVASDGPPKNHGVRFCES